MSEFTSRFENVPATVESVEKTVTDWERDPIGNDPGIARIGAAISHLLRGFEPFRGSVHDFLEARQDPENYFHVTSALPRPIGSEFAANLIRSAIQYNLLCLPSGKRYPDDYPDPDSIEHEVAAWYREQPDHPNDFTRKDHFEINLVRRFMTTNWWKRAVGVKIADYLYGPEFPQELRALDVGCSQGEVWAQLALNLPFGNFHILSEDPSSGIILPDSYLTQRVARSIRDEISITYSLGVDVNDPRDLDSINWAWSSRRPAELMDVGLMNYDYQLTTLDDSRLDFCRASFADAPRSIEEKIAASWPQSPARPNIITIFTTMYELPEPMVERFLNNAAELVSEDGVVLIQEPADISSREFKFYDNFRLPGVYKLYGWWPHRNRGPEWLATYDSARCNAAYLNPDLLSRSIKRH